MASTMTTYAALLKTRYTTKKVEDLSMSTRPFLARLNKDTDFSGDGTVIPLIHANPQGVAGSRTGAQSAASNLKSKKFTLTHAEYDGEVEIGDDVLVASRNNPGAFLSNKTAEIDGLYEQVADTIAIHLTGNGGGALGRRLSASTNVITLYNGHDTYAFEEGMTVVASDADGEDAADSLRSGSTTVASVERAAGTVTLASAAAISSFANDDYLFRANEFAGDTAIKIIKGLGAYITATDVPGTLFGMTRTSDPSRLAGIRVASAELTGKNNEERLRWLCSLMTGRHKGPGPTDIYMNPEDWEYLASSLQAKGNRPLKDETTRFGFQNIELLTGGGMVKIFSDRYFPKGTAFALRMQNWTLYSMLELIHPVERDGLTILRKASTNDYAYRLISYPQLACNAPGYNGRVTLN